MVQKIFLGGAYLGYNHIHLQPQRNSKTTLILALDYNQPKYPLSKICSLLTQFGLSTGDTKTLGDLLKIKQNLDPAHLW